MASRIRKFNTATGTTRALLTSSSLNASSRWGGIEVSNNGTVYVADILNYVVYKIFEQGTVSGALAGKINTAGDVLINPVGTGNDGSDARFEVPFGICVDSSDNIFVSDRTNKKIKKLSPHGKVQAIAGSGSTGDGISDNGSAATFSTTLGGICVDAAGVLYVTDTGNHKIKKIWPSGKVQTIAGGPGGTGVTGIANGVGNAARFASPEDCCVDKYGVIYVADTANNRIRKIDTNGNVTTLAGSTPAATTDGQGMDARFNAPKRVACDPSGQFLYVLDGNGAIRRVTAAGKVTSIGTYFIHPGTYRNDLCVDKSGFLYVNEAEVGS